MSRRPRLHWVAFLVGCLLVLSLQLACQLYALATRKRPRKRPADHDRPTPPGVLP